MDERGEIAALYKGMPQNDIGIKTDIIENVLYTLAFSIPMLVQMIKIKNKIMIFKKTNIIYLLLYFHMPFVLFLQVI